jgi:hypothetical protein
MIDDFNSASELGSNTYYVRRGVTKLEDRRVANEPALDAQRRRVAY